jgi:hypothetical protein
VEDGLAVVGGAGGGGRCEGQPREEGIEPAKDEHEARLASRRHGCALRKFGYKIRVNSKRHGASCQEASIIGSDTLFTLKSRLRVHKYPAWHPYQAMTIKVPSPLQRLFSFIMTPT